MADSPSGSNSPRRPMSSFQPASSLPRDLNAPISSANASTSNMSGTSSRTGNGTGGTGAGITQPRPRPLIRGAVGTGNTVLVNNCQRGNPVLQHIRNIGWEYADIVPDYQVGVSSCILFLSIRYHRLHPEYVHTRIQKLAQMFTLRILLVMCDVNDHQAAIKELTKTALINNLTMIVAWSAEEAGRYIETYKSFENKPPDLIKERVGQDYLSQVTNVLTQVRGVNRTDVVTLLSRFGSVRGIVKAEMDEVGMCPGFGEVKAKRLRDVFHQPFRVGESRSFKQRKLNSAKDDTLSTTTTTTTSTRTTTTTSNDGGAARLLELDLLPPSEESQPDADPPINSGKGSKSSSTNPPATTTTVAATPTTTTTTTSARALDALEENFDDLTEEEQLRLAMQLSMHPPSPQR